MKRSGPLRRRGRKAERDQAEIEATRPAVTARSRGVCEVAGCVHAAEQVHHRLRRSQGGDNSLRNLLDVCRACHSVIHGNPGWAYGLGYLLRSGSDPAISPLCRPSTATAVADDRSPSLVGAADGTGDRLPRGSS